MRVQVQGLNNELAALRAQRGALQSQLAQLESRVELAPEVGRELLELTRDYNLANQAYDDAPSTQMAADRTGVISGEQLTENYKIQRPANLPWEPWFPNRPLFMTIGVFLGLTLGVGAGLAAEALDSTVRGTRDVRTILEMPPIAAVPFVATARDLRRQRFRRLAASLGVIVLVVGVGLYVQLQRSGAV
jgi:capsular polysaccharide biosynthesis protein